MFDICKQLCEHLLTIRAATCNDTMCDIFTLASFFISDRWLPSAKTIYFNELKLWKFWNIRDSNPRPALTAQLLVFGLGQVNMAVTDAVRLVFHQIVQQRTRGFIRIVATLRSGVAALRLRYTLRHTGRYAGQNWGAQCGRARGYFVKGKVGSKVGQDTWASGQECLLDIVFGGKWEGNGTW